MVNVLLHHPVRISLVPFHCLCLLLTPPQANSQGKFRSGLGSFSPVSQAFTPENGGLYSIHSVLWYRGEPCKGARGALWSTATVGMGPLWEQPFPGLFVGSMARITHWPVTSCTRQDVWEGAKALLSSASSLPGSPGVQVRMPIPQVLQEQTCNGMPMVGEPVFKGDRWLILDKDKSYGLVATHNYTDQKTERGKGGVKEELNMYLP